jgi:uncharacterized protein (TIGR03435 family)
MTRPPLAAILLASRVLLAQEFEIASVKPSTPEERSISMSTWPGGRITVTNFTLQQLIQHAYGVQRFQISAGPGWIDSDRYSIEARPPASSESSKFSPSNPKTPPPKEELLMLQALLADRFQLKVHRETKEGTILALVITSKGPKLQPPKNRDDRPLVMYGFDNDAKGARIYYVQGDNATMTLLAQRLADLMGRSVRDETGLAGNFDFKCSFEEDATKAGMVAAMQQLGLKLESRKGPIEMLVIDHAEKPSAN